MSGRDRPADRPALEAIGAGAVTAVRRAARGIRSPLLLIDGPSGAGKSNLADAVVAAWPGEQPVLVRLDDAYPGWSGLAQAGLELERTLARRVRRGAVGAWRRWDWVTGRHGVTESVRPGTAVIVEGCGAFALCDAIDGGDIVRVWVDAPDDLRKQRALRRDAGAYDPFWELWETQWRRYVRRDEPARAADIVVSALRGGRPAR